MTVLTASAAPGLAPAEQRVVDAALRCIARWGVGKTTLDDVAREAGCSRATIYRLFPGGKDALLETVARSELDRFFAGVGERLEEAATLEDMLVAGIAEAAARITGHDALQYLLAHEPEAILPHLAFAKLDAVLATAAEFAAPHLGRHLPHHDAVRAAEWVTRLVVSYTSTPAAGMDVTDPEQVRGLVRAFVLPGLTTAART